MQEHVSCFPFPVSPDWSNVVLHNPKPLTWVTHCLQTTSLKLSQLKAHPQLPYLGKDRSLGHHKDLSLSLSCGTLRDAVCAHGEREDEPADENGGADVDEQHVSEHINRGRKALLHIYATRGRDFGWAGYQKETCHCFQGNNALLAATICSMNSLSPTSTTTSHRNY